MGFKINSYPNSRFIRKLYEYLSKVKELLIVKHI